MKDNHKDIEYVLRYYSIKFQTEPFCNISAVRVGKDNYIFYLASWENNGITTKDLITRFKYVLGGGIR